MLVFVSAFLLFKMYQSEKKAKEQNAIIKELEFQVWSLRLDKRLDSIRYHHVELFRKRLDSAVAHH